MSQYKVDRLNAEVLAFSSADLNKYEFLTRKDLNYKPNALDKARFEFSPLGRAFNEGLDKTVVNYQEKDVIKLLKDIRDNLAGGIFIPGPPGPPGPGGPPRHRPRLRPSDDGDNFAKEMDAKNKEFNDAMNRIKSNELNLKRQKEFNDLMNKIKNDRLNLERQKEINASDKEFNDLMNKMKNETNRTNQTDETNQTYETNQTGETDQIDEDELELIKVKLALGDLKPLRPIDLLRTIDLSISRPPDTIRVKNTSKIQKIEDTFNSMKKNSKELEENEKYGPGIDFAICTMELEIKNAYNNINILDDKLKNNLKFAEYKKIIDNIDQLKKSIPKKEQELPELKKGAEKRVRANQAKSFKDQNK